MESDVQPQQCNDPELQPELEPEPELEPVEPGPANAATTGVSAQPAPAVAYFLEHIDAATGRKYYSNEATQAVSWELPAGAVVRPPAAVCHDELTTEQREVQAQREATEYKARKLLETIAATRLSNEEAVAARRAAEAAEAAASSQTSPSGSPSLVMMESHVHHQLQHQVEDDTGGPTPRTLHSQEQQHRIEQLETKVRRLQVALGKASRTEDNTRSTLAGELDEEREKLLREVETEKQYVSIRHQSFDNGNQRLLPWPPHSLDSFVLSHVYDASREAAGKVRAIKYKMTKLEAALATAEARVQELESSFDARVAAAVYSQLDAQGHGTAAGSSLQREVEQLKVALKTALEEKEAARVAAEMKACERVAAVLEQTNFEREQNDQVLGGRCVYVRIIIDAGFLSTSAKCFPRSSCEHDAPGCASATWSASASFAAP